ncbi:GumC family protein [Phaeobacter marinintestinus]|uniref:GumC family protein n=1 Tax=Falsiphaeobacter marinintestinus TaxID=1492905 RepID=UPI0011B3C714|nr:hypothetical protein [Phaeobacter marinintestinus]
MDGVGFDHKDMMNGAPSDPGVEVADFLQEEEPTEFSPFAALGRLMRGRWLILLVLMAVLGGGLGYLGFTSGKAIYESQAILRISAREPGILFASGDDSKLKLFQSFVKAETTYVASHPVMERAVELITAVPSPYNDDLTAKTLAESISIKRKEALIILTSPSKDAEFAARKINAVIDAYLALHDETRVNLSNFRESELAARETDLLGRLDAIMDKMLDVGGEFGMASLVKTHIEKVAQIETLVSRRAEVEATLVALQSQDGSGGSADMADQEIMRATLLDRALADLNFDKAKREAELTTLLGRYHENATQVIEKREQIEIVSQAMADRRNQIQVLGQTGALTDGGQSSREDSLNEIRAVLDKVTKQLETARNDARDLNRKRIELAFLEEERDEARRMLDETRRALDVIRVESRNSMPGLVEVMSRAIVADKPAEDSSKMMAAGGFSGGAFLAILLVVGFAVSRKSLRFSDDLWRHLWRMPLLLTTRAKPGSDAFGQAMVRLRNNVSLFPGRQIARPGKARIIAVNHFGKADAQAVAKTLADSFAAARLPTLYIDADLQPGDLSANAGWRDLVAGEFVTPMTTGARTADIVESGAMADVTDASVSVHAVRAAFDQYADDYAVIVINAGSLDTGLSTELIMSASDLVLSAVAPGDNLPKVNASVGKCDSLSRHGAGFVMTGATRKDPALAAA